MFFYTDFTFKALVIASLLLKLQICIDERANGNHMHIHVMNTKQHWQCLHCCNTPIALRKSGVQLRFSTSHLH